MKVQSCNDSDLREARRELRGCIASISFAVATWSAAHSAADWPQFQAEGGKVGAAEMERMTLPLVTRFIVSTNASGGETVFNLATAVSVGDTVFVGTTAGTVVAASRRTGAVSWTAQTGGPIAGAPVVVAGDLIVGSGDGTVRALHLDDGSVRWKVSGNGPVAAPVTLALIDDELRLYAAGTNGTLWCLRASDGSQVWSRTVGGRVWGSPAVSSAGRVYVGSYDEKVYAFEADSGARAWVTDPGSIGLGPVRANVTVRGTRLYVPTLSRGLAAVDDTGSGPALAWMAWTGSHTGGAAVSQIVGSSATAIFVANDFGELYGVRDTGSGNVIDWTSEFDGRVAGSVAYADGKVFAVSEDRTLRAFDAVSGFEDYSVSVTEAVDSSLAISEGGVYLSDASGRLYGFGNALEAPRNLAATVTVTGGVGVIALSWEPVLLPPMDTPVSGYNVYRSTGPDGQIQLIGFVGVTSYVDATVASYVTYYYAVTALDLLGGSPPMKESSFSNRAYAMYPATPPSLGGFLTTGLASVCVGQNMAVYLTVSNTGQTTADGVTVPEPAFHYSGAGSATLVSGPAPSMPTYVIPGSSVTFTWTFTGLGAGSVTLSTTLMGFDASNGTPLASVTVTGSLMVTTPASLSVATSISPAVVSRGQPFTVMATVTNTGGGTVTGLIPSISGGNSKAVLAWGPTPAGPVALAAGASQTFSWTYSTVGTTNGICYTPTVTGTACGSFIQASGAKACAIIQTPANISIASFTAVPSSVCIGQAFEIRLVVGNSGVANIEGFAMPPLTPMGSGTASLAWEPTFPISLVGGAPAVTLVFGYTATGAGQINFSASATGFDFNSGAMLFVGPVISTTAQLSVSGVLAASASASASPVSLGEELTVSMTATNTGDAIVAGVSATMFITTGADIVSLVSAAILNTSGTTGSIFNVAGYGPAGFDGDGGPGPFARLWTPMGVALDSAGNVYIADYNNRRIRKVDATTGVISTIAGTGASGTLGDWGPASAAQLIGPRGIAISAQDDIFISDSKYDGVVDSRRIRKITSSSGIITTVAGVGPFGYNGDNISATVANLGDPSGLALSPSGDIYFADSGNYRIRKVSAATGLITTVAGNGISGYNGDNISATAAQLSYPFGVALDGDGILYVGDSNNYRVRKIDTSSGVISTVAGTGSAGYNGDGISATSATLSSPRGVALDHAGNLLIAAGNRIRQVNRVNGKIVSVAGDGTSVGLGNPGMATKVGLSQPYAVATASGGRFYLVDLGDNRVRVVLSPMPFVSLAPGAAETWKWTFAPTAAGDLSVTTLAAGVTCGTSLMQASATAFTVIGSPPYLVGLTAIAGDGVIRIGWTVTPGTAPLDTVVLFRRDGVGATTSYLASWSDGTTGYYDARVEDELEYGYRVVATDVNGVSSTNMVEATAMTAARDWPALSRNCLRQSSESATGMAPPLGERYRVFLTPDANGTGFSGSQGGIEVGGTLFVVSRGGDVRAYNTYTGATIWMQSGYQNAGAGPAYFRGRLHVATDSGLAALNDSTGAVEWSLGTGAFGVAQESSPVVYKSYLYTVTSLSGSLKLVCVDLVSHGVAWTSEPLSGTVVSGAGAAADRVFVSADDGAVRAYHALTGATLWQDSFWEVPGTPEATVLVRNPEMVLVAHASGTLFALDPATGGITWSRTTGSRPAISVDGGTVYISSSSALLDALAISDGHRIWSATLAEGSGGAGGPVLEGTRLHAQSASGELVTVDSSTGAWLDTAELGEVIGFSHLAAGGGQLYVPLTSGTLLVVGSVSYPPTELTGLGGVNQVTLSWTPALANQYAVSGYRIWRASVVGGSEALIGTLYDQATSTFIDTGMPLRSLSSYRVAAVDATSVSGRRSAWTSVMPAPVLTSVTIFAVPYPGCDFQTVDISLTVSNTGGNLMEAVTPSTSLMLSGHMSATLLASPWPVATLLGGGSTTFVWSYRVHAIGPVEFTASVTALDPSAGIGLATGPISFSMSIDGFGALTSTLLVSSTMILGDTLTVIGRVHNGGAGPLATVTPVQSISSTVPAVLLSGPDPASVALLSPGGDAYFTWTYSMSSPGKVKFTTTFTGTRCDGASTTSISATACLVSGTAPWVTWLTAVAGDGLIRIGWTVTPGSDGLQKVTLLRREGVGGVTAYLSAFSVGTTEFDDVHVEDGVEYGYRLVASGLSGVSSTTDVEAVAITLTKDWPALQRDFLRQAEESATMMTPPLGLRYLISLMPDENGTGFSASQGGIEISGTLFVVSSAGEVKAFNALTGELLWTRSGYTNAGTGLVHSRGRLYVAGDDWLTELSDVTGSETWHLGPGYLSTPTSYKGYVYSVLPYVGGGRLVCVDTATHLFEWLSLVTIPSTSISGAGATANRVFIAADDGSVRAYDALTGGTLWVASFAPTSGVPETPTPVRTPSIVLVPHASGSLYALDAATGALSWSVTTGSQPAIAVSGGTVFVTSTSTNLVLGLSLADGHTIWSATLTGGTVGAGGPVVVGTRLHVHAADGSLVSLEASTGEWLDTAELGISPGFGHPAGGGGQLYVPMPSGTLLVVGAVSHPPTNLTLLGGVSQVTLSWTPAQPNQYAISGYLVWRSSALGGVESLIGEAYGAAASQYVDTGMPLREVSWYRVAAVDVTGVPGRKSGWTFGMPGPVLEVATGSALPSLGCGFQPVTVSLTVSNAGGNLMEVVTPSASLMVAGHLSATLLSSPTVVAVLPGGSVTTFVWNYMVQAAGPVTFTATVTAVDPASGLALTSGPVTFSSTIEGFGAMTSDVLVSNTVIVGASLTVVSHANNSGNGPLTSVTPVASVSSTILAVLLTGPSPASVDILAAGGDAYFTWTYSITGGGTVSFSASLTAMRCDGATVASSSGGQSTASYAGGEWVMWGHDPYHTFRQEVPMGLAPPLQLVWSRTTDSPMSPIVVGNTSYWIEKTGGGGVFTRLRARDILTGDLIWENTGFEFLTPWLAYDSNGGGRVWAVGQANKIYLVGFNATTGVVERSASVYDQSAVLTVADGIAYAVGDVDNAPGSTSQVRAFSLTTSGLPILFTLSDTGARAKSIHSFSPTVVGTTLYLTGESATVTGSSQLVAADARTGAVRLTRVVPYWPTVGASIPKMAAYLTYNGTNLVFAGRKVVTGDDQSVVVEFNPQTGATESELIDSNVNRDFGNPTVVSATTYVRHHHPSAYQPLDGPNFYASESNQVSNGTLAGQSQKLLWGVKAADSPNTALNADGYVYMQEPNVLYANHNLLQVIRMSDHQLVWSPSHKVHAYGEEVTAPAVARGLVFMDGGYVYGPASVTPPTALSLLPGDNQVHLSWQPPVTGATNVTAYQIYRSKGEGMIWATPVDDQTQSNVTLVAKIATATEYVDTTALNNIRYYYAVRAVIRLAPGTTASTYTWYSNEETTVPYIGGGSFMVIIFSPEEGSLLDTSVSSGEIEVLGTVLGNGDDPVDHYVLDIRHEGATNFEPVAQGDHGVERGRLGGLDITRLRKGLNLLRLRGFSRSGRVIEVIRRLIITGDSLVQAAAR